MLDVAQLFERYGTLLRSGGTNQRQRTLPALETGYILPDERHIGALLNYAGQAGGALWFHSLSGQPSGSWAPLFDLFRDQTGQMLPDPQIEALLEARDDLPPQLALMVAFLRAFGAVQDDLNRLPDRHMAHYVEKVLGLNRRGAVADKAHVVFELGRNAGLVRLTAGTVLAAGAGGEGRERQYVLTRETVLSRATVGQIARRSIVADAQGRLRLFRADMPESADFATFGDAPFEAGSVMVETDPGFAVADPVLRMAEGTRTLEMIIRLAVTDGQPVPTQTLSNQVKVAVTGTEGWHELTAAATVLTTDGDGPLLRITATMAVADPAVVDFKADLHGGTGAPRTADWPVLRCLVDSVSGRAELLARFTVVSVATTVSVNGLTDLVLQNDQRKLDAGAPVALFTQKPRLGATFYIGNAEVFAKRLTSLTISYTWDGLPANLLQHYDGYFDFQDAVLTQIFESSFTAVVDLLGNRSWDHRLTGPAGVFRLFANGQSTRSVTFSQAAIDGAFGGTGPVADPGLTDLARYDVSTRRGFLRMQLTGPERDDLTTFGVPYAQSVPFEAFGHEAFSRRYAQAAIDVARYDPTAINPGPEPTLPPEPYTPLVTDLALGYHATAQFTPGDVQAHERLYTLDAFGNTTAGPGEVARLVPEFTPRAELMIGLNDFAAPGTISMLFQLDEGTAALADPPQPADIVWAYLADDTWIDLPSAAVVVDETGGFQVPGIVAIAIGNDATTDHSAMPAGLTWLRARITKPAGVAAHTLALHTQAATVEFAPVAPDRLEDFTAHLSGALAPESINRLIRSRAEVKAVTQPYASFGGRPFETDPKFFERSSERLRHRARAVTAWDFEHLLLENFSELFKVRALPHRGADATDKAGEVALVIVPNRYFSATANRLEPRSGETLMQSIRDFVADGTANQFARVNVIHPEYERVRVFASVAFRPGFDPGFYSNQLNQDLQRFLSPWAFDEGRDIVFGTHVYRSELLKYVEDRDYVDYVTRFEVYHAFDGPPQGGIGAMEIALDFIVGTTPDPALSEMTIGEDFIVGEPIEAAQSIRPEAVLVSHPEHIIKPVFDGSDDCPGVSQLGIGYMIVGLDFNVSNP